MFNLTIKTDNSAFDGQDGERDPYARDREIARILRKIAKRLEDGSGDIELETCLDSNGNTVGKWTVG